MKTAAIGVLAGASARESQSGAGPMMTGADVLWDDGEFILSRAPDGLLMPEKSYDSL
jgi:hypothetical protein